MTTIDPSPTGLAGTGPAAPTRPNTERGWAIAGVLGGLAAIASIQLSMSASPMYDPSTPPTPDRRLVITMSDDNTSVAAAMRAGARGYLLKAAAPDEVERAVRAVANGEMILGAQVAVRAMAQVVGGRAAVRVPFPELTDREREVLDLVARGFDNATISQRLVLSPKTVRNHVANVLAKLSLKDRAAAIVAAREAGLGG